MVSIADETGELSISLIEICQIDQSLNLKVEASSHTFNGKDELYVTRPVFDQFLLDLRALEVARKGEALLEAMSPRQFELRIHAYDSMGHIRADGILTHIINLRKREAYSRVGFEIEIDPTRLAALCDLFEQLVTTPRRVKCRQEGVYPGLQRGELYEVLGESPDRGELILRDRNGRKRKYPASFFVDPNEPLTSLERWTTQDDCQPGCELCEVDLEFSDGSKRFVNFVELPNLAKRVAEVQGFSAFTSHEILVQSISRERVSQILYALEAQDELLEHSLPFGVEDELALSDDAG